MYFFSLLIYLPHYQESGRIHGPTNKLEVVNSFHQVTNFHENTL